MNDPGFINHDGGSPEYSAAELRRIFAVLLVQGVTDRFGARSGVHPGGGNAVTLSGSTINVQHTKAVVYPGLSGTAGPYLCQIPATTHALQGADGTNPRKDIVILRVYDDDEDSSGQREAVTEYITGTPAVSPSEPNVPDSSVRLATIDVPQVGGGAAVLTFNAPYVVANGGILPVRTTGERPSAGRYDGMMVWRRDVQQLEVLNEGGPSWDPIASNEIALRGQVVAALHRTTAQSMANEIGGSGTRLSWNAFEINHPMVDGWSLSPNPTRFTPKLAGWYKFEGAIGWTGNSSGSIRGCLWRKNGGSTGGGDSSRTIGTASLTSAEVCSPARTIVVSMNGTSDFVEMAGLQNSGSTLNTATGGNRPNMVVTYVGPL